MYCSGFPEAEACIPVHTCDRHHAILFRSAGPFGGFELCYRLSRFHGHMTLCIAVIGTSDQSCWLAEACKILLLLPDGTYPFSCAWQWLAGSYFCQGDGSPSDLQVHTYTHTFISILDMIAKIGTSDQPCWLAEACKILLLLPFRATSA